MSSTSERIVGEARQLIARHGYNGFSYADIAAALGIRKASIHHHFPGKSDLARAVLAQSQDAIATLAAALADAPQAREQLRGYVGYWERCIGDDSAPFCVAGLLAAELPSLPDDVAAAVRAHFDMLKRWLADVLELGARQGTAVLAAAPDAEAEAFLSAIYGAMLAARAFGDPGRFRTIVDALLARMIVLA